MYEKHANYGMTSTKQKTSRLL